MDGRLGSRQGYPWVLGSTLQTSLLGKRGTGGAAVGLPQSRDRAVGWEVAQNSTPLTTE